MPCRLLCPPRCSFDEGRTLLLHSGEKTPDSPLFVHDELFKTGNYPSFVLPNGPEPLGALRFQPLACWLVNRGLQACQFSMRSKSQLHRHALMPCRDAALQSADLGFEHPRADTV